jgi:putative ATP-binding cassette transporter
MSRIDTMGLRLAAIAAPEPAQVDAAHLSWRSIELRGITHSYRREGEDGEFVLGPIDLTLHPGEVVFIAGGNGSGKTTLAKLLTGLYVPDLGEILWDGRPVDDGNRDIYRQSFSAVFSDFFLFTSLLGIDPDQMDAQAAHYLKKLHLQQKVRVTDGKLSTVELSQGQRKRLALLTAYLEDRPVYLFDEWAADQDPFFKEVFYRQLLPELKRRNKAVVVISHDDRYFDAGDRLIKLESGQMVVQAVPA